MPAPDSQSRTFLHPVSGALILGLDWVLFSENAMTLGLSTPLVILVGFGSASLGTSLIQHLYHDDGLGKAVLIRARKNVAPGVSLRERPLTRPADVRCTGTDLRG
ncbi:MAG: hypothetical protein BRD43_04760 [Bacteroidetes bacterium QS_4_64_154]|nr:MAG: hypothetical protein BRD43_04760 [Bacteroidetes bacterium QS_4_64_154]